jgi:hypothetical protein
MQKDKHNIYSKEELLKLIKEGKNAPADMDEFDLEALEGLKLLDKPSVLNKLDKEIDYIIAKEKKKKAIYYFSAAASLFLIIGLVFFLKNEVVTNVTKSEKHIASAENLKASEKSILSNTNPPAQPETQTTYEAKEPEALAKKTPITKKEDPNSFAYQTNSAPVSVPAEEKMQEVKQVGKDANSTLEGREVLSKKADNYEESKADPPQIKQEQQGLATSETTIASNNTISGASDNDVSKTKQVTATGNNAQPTQAAFAKANVPASGLRNEKDESVVVQKNKTAGLYRANSPDKKTATKSYREPAFMGGDTAFTVYAKQNLKISSPANSGIIVVEFLITKTGKTEKIKIIKPLTDCASCSQDVIDLIKSVKNWSPAVIDGNNSAAFKKISVQYN